MSRVVPSGPGPEGPMERTTSSGDTIGSVLRRSFIDLVESLWEGALGALEERQTGSRYYEYMSGNLVALKDATCCTRYRKIKTSYMQREYEELEFSTLGNSEVDVVKSLRQERMLNLIWERFTNVLVTQSVPVLSCFSVFVICAVVMPGTSHPLSTHTDRIVGVVVHEMFFMFSASLPPVGFLDPKLWTFSNCMRLMLTCFVPAAFFLYSGCKFGSSEERMIGYNNECAIVFASAHLHLVPIAFAWFFQQLCWLRDDRTPRTGTAANKMSAVNNDAAAGTAMIASSLPPSLTSIRAYLECYVGIAAFGNTCAMMTFFFLFDIVIVPTSLNDDSFLRNFRGMLFFATKQTQAFLLRVLVEWLDLPVMRVHAQMMVAVNVALFAPFLIGQCRKVDELVVFLLFDWLSWAFATMSALPLGERYWILRFLKARRNRNDVSAPHIRSACTNETCRV